MDSIRHLGQVRAKACSARNTRAKSPSVYPSTGSEWITGKPYIIGLEELQLAGYLLDA
jgi:hypothetical protein